MPGLSGHRDAWAEGSDCTSGPCPLYYARSIDGGASFSAATLLTGVSDFAMRRQIARSGQVVAVVWTDAASAQVFARVSSDGGSTFGTAKVLGKTTNTGRSGNLGSDGFASVAVGQGVIYATYHSKGQPGKAATLKLRRSTNNGASWLSAITVSKATDGVDPATLSASGKNAVIVYAHRLNASLDALAVRRTTNKGASWKAEQRGFSASNLSSSNPVSTVNGTKWSVAFARCSSAECDMVDIYLTQSTNAGKTWSTPSLVQSADATHSLLVPYGIAYSSKLAIMYWKSDWAFSDYDCWVVAGSGRLLQGNATSRRPYRPAALVGPVDELAARRLNKTKQM